MRRRKDKERNKLHITDDDPNDEDMWVEKNIDMDGERVSLYCTGHLVSRLLMHIAASGDRHSYSRELEADILSDCWTL